MKKIFYYLAVAICISLLGSCDSAGKLAKEVQGSWAGAPQKMSDQAGMQATLIDTYTFSLDSNDTAVGGNVQITSLVSSMTQLVGQAGLFEPLSLSASSTVSIAGQWRAVDDDEIELKLDVPAMKVTVDPSAVVVSTNTLTGNDTPELASFKAQAAANIEAQIRALMTLKYSALRMLDDVKVKKGNILKFEIGKDKFILTRQ